MKVDNRTRVFDKRVVQRYIRAGRVTKEEYASWLTALPNAQENIMASDEGGDSDGYEGEDEDDYDDEDEDDDDLDRDDGDAVSAAPDAEPAIAAAPPVASPSYVSSPPAAAPAPAASAAPSADDLFRDGTGDPT